MSSLAGRVGEKERLKSLKTLCRMEAIRINSAEIMNL
jgi:hypothetical protein